METIRAAIAETVGTKYGPVRIEIDCKHQVTKE